MIPGASCRGTAPERPRAMANRCKYGRQEPRNTKGTQQQAVEVFTNSKQIMSFFAEPIFRRALAPAIAKAAANCVVRERVESDHADRAVGDPQRTND